MRPWTRPAALRTELRAALEGMEAGGEGRLVATPLGWQLLRMEEKRASRKLPFEEVLHLIENRLYHEKFKENVDRVARQLIKRAYVYPPDLFGDED